MSDDAHPRDEPGGGARGEPTEGGTTEPPAPRRLVRYPDRGPLAGVSEGLGVHFGVDPVVLRIVFVALAVFAFPLGLVLYAICWLAIPAASADAEAGGPPRDHRFSEQRTRTWLGVTLLIIGGVWLLGQLAALPVAGVFGFDALGSALTSGSVLAVLLVAGGVALLLFDRRESDADDPPSPGTPSGLHAPAGAASPSSPAGAASPAGPAGSPPSQRASTVTAPSDAAETPAPSRTPRSRLGRLTAGATLVALGVTWWLDQAGAVDAGVRDVLAVALLVVGGGLIVGAWWGRSRGLIGWGVVLTVLVLVASIPAMVGLDDVRTMAVGGMGERSWQPATAEEIAPRYELGMGDATLDLSEIDFDGADVAVAAHVGLGELTVYVPDDVDVDTDGSVGVGELRLFDLAASGMGNLERRVADTVADPAGELDLTASVGMGELVVTRR